jgi:hypothetical protein
MADYEFGFLMEQSLGHVTHTKNLVANVALDPEVHAHWGLVDFEAPRKDPCVPEQLDGAGQPSPRPAKGRGKRGPRRKACWSDVVLRLVGARASPSTGNWRPMPFQGTQFVANVAWTHVLARGAWYTSCSFTVRDNPCECFKVTWRASRCPWML